MTNNETIFRICPTCTNKIFYKRGGLAPKYCNQQCYWKSGALRTGKYITTPCKQCTKNFRYIFYDKVRSFCSRSCYFEFLKITMVQGAESLPKIQQDAPKIISKRNFTYFRTPFYVLVSGILGGAMTFIFNILMRLFN